MCEKVTAGDGCQCGCMPGPMFWSKKKKIEMMKKCLSKLNEKAEDLKEAIKEIE